MIDFEVLDEYANQFHGLDKKRAAELEQRVAGTKRDKWILRRFLDGYLSRIWMFKSNALTLIPTSKEINKDALEVIAEGISEYFIQYIGLSINIVIDENCLDQLKNTVNYNRTRTERGSVTKDFNYSGAMLRKRGRLPDTYLALIDDSEFFEDNDGCLAGRANMEDGVITLLQRALKKGRIKNGSYISMSQKDKIEYMKIVAAHETYHSIGLLTDLEAEGHRFKGLPERTDCVGYSDFQIPARICEGCKDGILALWYGIQLRSNRIYLNHF